MLLFAQKLSDRVITLEILRSAVCSDVSCRVGCEEFVGAELKKAWQKAPEIMNLTIVPYGNAKLTPSGNVTCQHGPEVSSMMEFGINALQVN